MRRARRDAAESPAPTIAGELASIDARLRRIEDAIARLSVPDERLTEKEARAMLKCCRRKLTYLTSAGMFSDARAPGDRRKGVPRLFFTAELEAWLTEGAAGVKRLRKQLGRL